MRTAWLSITPGRSLFANGIGRSIALKLASEGARLVINDLDAGPANDTVEEIRALGGEAVACAGSVSAPDFADRFVGTAIEAYKGLDIIINNAGYTWDSVIQKMTDEQWYAMIDVHLTAPFRILRAAQPVIRKTEIDFEIDEKTVILVDNIRDDNFYDLNNSQQLSYIAGFFSSQLNTFFDRNVEHRLIVRSRHGSPPFPA